MVWKIFSALFAGTLFFAQPSRNALRFASISEASFFPIARRSSSAWARVKPASWRAASMTCSW